MNLAEAFVGEVSVNLGGGDLGMSEEHLDGTKVRAAVQEICGKTIMRKEAIGD